MFCALDVQISPASVVQSPVSDITMISVSSSTEGTYTTILYGSTTAVMTDPVFDGSNVPETYIRDQSLVPPPHVLRTKNP